MSVWCEQEGTREQECFDLLRILGTSPVITWTNYLEAFLYPDAQGHRLTACRLLG